MDSKESKRTISTKYETTIFWKELLLPPPHGPWSRLLSLHLLLLCLLTVTPPCSPARCLPPMVLTLKHAFLPMWAALCKCACHLQRWPVFVATPPPPPPSCFLSVISSFSLAALGAGRSEALLSHLSPPDSREQLPLRRAPPPCTYPVPGGACFLRKQRSCFCNSMHHRQDLASAQWDVDLQAYGGGGHA